jgi:cytochrome c oxidase subunit II
VQRRRWLRRLRLAALAAGSTVLLASCSRSDLEDKLRFGFPTGVTKQADKMRVLWIWCCVAALLVGILVWGLIFWCIGRYHKRTEEMPRQTKYNLPLEVFYTIVPIMIVATLFFFTVRTLDYVGEKTPNPDVVVQVDAFKWNWQFEYHSYHGQDLVYPNPPAGTPRTNGKAYASTVGTSTEIPVLVIPRGETVRFVEHSVDVIHSFWVPEFLFKRDVIPYEAEARDVRTPQEISDTNSDHRDNQFEITPTVNGSYVGRCAELCGTYHSQMNFEVRIVDPATFQAYIQKLLQLGPDNAARQSTALAAVGGAPCATTTHPFNTDRTARSASQPTGVCG